MLSAQGRPCIIDGKSSTCPLVKPDAFLNAARSAEDIDAIINLSVGRAAKFTEIQDRLSGSSHVLFVVAAGNDHSDLATRQVYPARYGGPNNDGRVNLLTVAAMDFDGHRAAFSNYGADYVDLAAPGCSLPVLRRNARNDAFEPARASGTSFAAPLVSFTAALLQTVWPHVTPRQLRARILVSSNISSLLDPSDVADSRALDIGKSLSIYEDVVDGTVDGKHVRVRGKIDPSRTLFDFCSGQVSLYRSSGVNHRRIRKIAAVTRPTPGFLLYWESEDGVFGRTVCPRQSITMGIRDDFTNAVYEFTGDNITDVVFAEEH
jgi:hypothetical protein